MATATTSGTEAKGPKLNRLGLPMSEYKGAASTMCAGCGHDVVTSQIVKSFWEMDVQPWNVAKMSGIGCSSKTTAYFLGQSHGFNGVHGRMAAIATGSFMANHTVVHCGVSGDGDTASIGLGNFMHMVRRNLPIVYIIENNGVYALTKGQFSATADLGTKNKEGVANDQPPVDCCALAITLGCTYVARSFAGDVSQVGALIKGAIAHKGTALIDIISPCMTFNNHEGSTKSLSYVKANKTTMQEIDFVPAGAPCETPTVDYQPGETFPIGLGDGSQLLLKKLDNDFDPTDKIAAFALLEKAYRERMILTGLIYHGTEGTSFDERLNMIDQPMATLPESVTRPSAEALKHMMENWR